MGNDVIVGSELIAVNMNNMCVREGERASRERKRDGEERRGVGGRVGSPTYKLNRSLSPQTFSSVNK